MLLKELYSQFVSGTPIKRKPWKGYWKYKFGKIEMHNQNGSIENLTETKDILFTLSNVIQEDWEVATTQNSPVLLKEVQNKKESQQQNVLLIVVSQ